MARTSPLRSVPECSSASMVLTVPLTTIHHPAISNRCNTAGLKNIRERQYPCQALYRLYARFICPLEAWDPFRCSSGDQHGWHLSLQGLPFGGWEGVCLQFHCPRRPSCVPASWGFQASRLHRAWSRVGQVCQRRACLKPERAWVGTAIDCWLSWGYSIALDSQWVEMAG